VTGNKISVKPLHNFGVEIKGVDLSSPQDDASIATLRRHWTEHGVIIFRDQHHLDESSLVRFSRYFGDLEIHVRREYLSTDNPEILYVSNKTKSGKSIGILSDHEVGWHHDQIYLERPALGSLLYAVEIPPSGGNTEFINLANAFDSLPAQTQQQIEPLRAVQSYAYFNGQWSEPRKAIYADPGMTVSVKGFPENKSRQLLDSLFEHAIRDEFLYSHEWQLGDAIMWDNASTMHRRGEFDSSHSRLMKRTTILPPADRAVPY